MTRKRALWRITRYFWTKRIEIALGIFSVIPAPSLIYLWLSGGLAMATGDKFIDAWSNPGPIALPICLSVLVFFLGCFLS